MNPMLYIKAEGCYFKVFSKGGKIFISNIKTTRQRKYRSLQEFYNEKMGIKENQADRMLRRYGRQAKGMDEKIKEQEEKLKELGIDKQIIIEEYKKEYVRYIEEFEFK